MLKDGSFPADPPACFMEDEKIPAEVKAGNTGVIGLADGTASTHVNPQARSSLICSTTNEEMSGKFWNTEMGGMPDWENGPGAGDRSHRPDLSSPVGPQSPKGQFQITWDYHHRPHALGAVVEMGVMALCAWQGGEKRLHGASDIEIPAKYSPWLTLYHHAWCQRKRHGRCWLKGLGDVRATGTQEQAIH